MSLERGTMTVQDLINLNKYAIINIGDKVEQSITTPFCCDLLSIAMGKAPTNSVWVTVMGNINTLAVASLAEVACIILAEGAVLDVAAIGKAKSQKITVLSSNNSIFDTAYDVYQMINGSPIL